MNIKYFGLSNFLSRSEKLFARPENTCRKGNALLFKFVVRYLPPVGHVSAPFGVSSGALLSVLSRLSLCVFLTSQFFNFFATGLMRDGCVPCAVLVPVSLLCLPAPKNPTFNIFFFVKRQVAKLTVFFVYILWFSTWFLSVQSLYSLDIQFRFARIHVTRG